MNEEKTFDTTKEQVEEQIKMIEQEGVQPGNVDYLYKLIDIHKDIANEEYWCKKGEHMDMRYRGDYDERYGRRDSRGRYASYRTYRNDDEMDNAYENYRTYRDEYDRYGHGDNKSLEKMLESTLTVFEQLMEENRDPEAMEMIQHYAKQIGNL